MNFNKELDKLEKIVSELKNETLDLDKALKLYDEGIQSYEICKNILTESKQKIEMINEDGGTKCMTESI